MTMRIVPFSPGPKRLRSRWAAVQPQLASIEVTAIGVEPGLRKAISAAAAFCPGKAVTSATCRSQTNGEAESTATPPTNPSKTQSARKA